MNESTPLGRLRLGWRMGELTLQQAVNAAADILESGVGSRSLERLAEGDVTGNEEAGALLDAAIAEAGFSMDLHDDVRSFVLGVAREISQGGVTPYSGARRIWNAAQLVPDDHTYDSFIYAASEYEDRPGDRPFFERAILKEAKKLALTE